MASLLCPVCLTALTQVGSHGIVDYDGDWDAQATKYVCMDGHTLFVVDSDDLITDEDDDEEAISPAFDAAMNEVERSLDNMEVEFDAGVEGYICLPPSGESSLDVYVKSLEDLRNELAKRAVATFKDFVSKDVSDEDYEYLEALEDVDDALVRHRKTLEDLKWLPKA